MYDSNSSLEDKMGKDWLHQRDQEDTMEVLQDEQEEDEERREEETLKTVTKHDEKEEKERRRFPEEEDEEILKESNSRFVLFPIKYREVSPDLTHQLQEIS
jgi:hypothetical protein